MSSPPLSGDPHQVARVFHKYDGASPDAWTAPATSDTPDDSGTAGTYSPLWTDESGGNAEVIYDRSFDVYLATYLHGATIEVRASADLLHWSKPIGPAYAEPGRSLIYPTLIGDTDAHALQWRLHPTSGAGSYDTGRQRLEIGSWMESAPVVAVRR